MKKTLFAVAMMVLLVSCKQNGSTTASNNDSCMEKCRKWDSLMANAQKFRAEKDRMIDSLRKHDTAYFDKHILSGDIDWRIAKDHIYNFQSNRRVLSAMDKDSTYSCWFDGNTIDAFSEMYHNSDPDLKINGMRLYFSKYPSSGTNHNDRFSIIIVGTQYKEGKNQDAPEIILPEGRDGYYTSVQNYSSLCPNDCSGSLNDPENTDLRFPKYPR